MPIAIILSIFGLIFSIVVILRIAPNTYLVKNDNRKTRYRPYDDYRIFSNCLMCLIPVVNLFYIVYWLYNYRENYVNGPYVVFDKELKFEIDRWFGL